MSEVADPTILSFKNNKMQEEFVFSPKRKTAYTGAIRSGKTLGGAARILYHADIMPGSNILVGRKYFTDLKATTMKEVLALIAARNGGNALEPGPLVIRSDGSAGGHSIYLRTQWLPSAIHFRPVDKIGKQLGLEISEYFLDQLEEVDPEVFDHVRSRLSWWNTQRREKFKEKLGYYPQTFESIAANPDPGWLKELLFEKESADWLHFQTTVEHNRKNLPPGFIEELLRTHPKAWVERFLNGSWDIRGGAVYQEFDENVHCVEPFRIPNHWPRFCAMDWGFNHPCCVLWGAVSEKGELYIYDELYCVGKLVSEVADFMHSKSKKHTAVHRADDGGLVIFIDPSTNAHHGLVDRNIMGEFAENKVYGVPANNAVTAGINKVAERLHFDPERKVKPKLFIFRGLCPQLVRTMKLYAWQPVNRNMDNVDRPIKKDDDPPDALRYLVMGVLETASDPKPMERKNKNEFDNMILEKYFLGDGRD